jgi:vacuolar iron transporter family protein
LRFELGLEKPDPKRAVVSAGTIAGAYIAGGFIPLGPYLLLPAAGTALTLSVVTTLIALAIFGYIKVYRRANRFVVRAKRCSFAG